MTLSRRNKRQIDELRHVALFGNCPVAELSEIDHLTTPASLPAGRILCREGRIGDEAFVIVDGEASVTVNGNEIARLGPGTFCGEMALLERGARSATVTAVTPMKVLVLSITDFDRILHLAPTVTRRMLREVSRRLRSLEHTGSAS
jgi:CRP-like cAMP-binding protein